MTSSFSAEYGRAGGAVLNTTLKSGTSKLRGSAWEFYRNDALNANDFFANRANIKKGEYLSNQYGFTAGGPIDRHEDVLVRRLRGQHHPAGAHVGHGRFRPRSSARAASRTSRISSSLQSGTVGADVLGRTLPARHGLRSGHDASAPGGPGRSGHRHRRHASGLRPRRVPRQPHSGGPDRSERPSADAALPGAQPARIEQQLRGQPHQHRRHALVRRPGRPQLQQQRSLLRALQLLGQPQDAPIAVRRRRRWRRVRRRRREGARASASRRATRTCSRRR